MSQKEMQHIINASHQRAGLMGFMLCLLQEEKELTIYQVKEKVVSMFTTMIDLEVMVSDEIDMEVAMACKDFCEQEQALSGFRSLLG